MQEVLYHETSVGDDEDADVDFEELIGTEEDTEMDSLLNERDDDTTLQTTEENILPTQYEINEELCKLRFKEPGNQFQQNVNMLIDYLLMNVDRVKQFCQFHWHELMSLYEKAIKEHDKGVPQSCFHSFYLSLQKYVTDVVYKDVLYFCALSIMF